MLFYLVAVVFYKLEQSRGSSSAQVTFWLYFKMIRS